MKRSIAIGRLAVGDRLSYLPEFNDQRVYAYRWVPDYADNAIRVGDYFLLDPDEGRHYGGKRAKRLTIRVPASELEYRQGDEFKWSPVEPRKLVAHASPAESHGGKRRHGGRAMAKKAKLPNKNKPETYISDSGYSYTLYPAESYSTYAFREETNRAKMVKKTRDSWIVKSPHTLNIMGLLHHWDDGEWTTQRHNRDDEYSAMLHTGSTPSEALEKLGSGYRKMGVVGGKKRHGGIVTEVRDLLRKR